MPGVDSLCLLWFRSTSNHAAMRKVDARSNNWEPHGYILFLWPSGKWGFRNSQCVDQFLHGLDKLRGCVRPRRSAGCLDNASNITMPERPQHLCWRKFNWKDLFYQKSLANTKQQFLMRTLLRLPEEVLCRCNKMMALWPIQNQHTKMVYIHQE